MQTWEYLYLEERVEKLKSLVQQLNGAGAEGWELVGIWSIKKGMAAELAAAILKRPISS